MSTNPDHINQLAATIREVDGSHAKGAADLAQPKGQSSLNVNLIIDTSPENLKRLCDGLAAAVTPNGGYEAATIDDPAPGTGGDQMVQVQWWIPQHGCDSLENTLDAIKYRISIAVTDWLATALVPVRSEQPDGDGPSLPQIDELCAEFGFHYDDDQGETLQILQEIIGAARTRWGRPATLEHVGGSINDEQREAVRAAVAEALGDAYDCTRVWEAWQVGTMGPDDFELVAEDEERVAAIADAAIEALRPATPPPLPSNYIDPEHQGEELELLQTFYRACQAEGGTADEIYLRGIRAVLSASPAAPPAPEPYNPTKDEVMDMAKSFQLEVNDQDALMWLVVTAIAAWGDASAAPPAPEQHVSETYESTAPELGEVADYLRDHGTWLIQSGYANESIQTRDLGIKVSRTATLLQRFSLGGRIVPTVEVEE
jgi:hypothetical protein